MTAYDNMLSMKGKKDPVPKMKSWRPTVEDEKLVNDLKAKLGILSESDLVRMALLALAENQKVYLH